MHTRKMLTIAALGALLGACGQGEKSGAGAAAEATPATAQPGERVGELPLKRGFYVASDTPCEQASNATLLLLRRDGISGSRDSCEFTQIERVGNTTYRVTERCADMMDPSGGETWGVTWEIPDDSSFSTLRDDGWEHSARHCEQSRLPEDWRDNDISDVTG
ncbi:MAG: hypothetical protein WBO04_11290 [Steroidobacteraceae bacterium]